MVSHKSPESAVRRTNHRLRSIYSNLIGTEKFAYSVLTGKISPAPHWAKMNVLRTYLPANSETMTFVETGTYLGQTVEVMRHIFAQVVSIEIEPALHAAATYRFSRATNVKLLLGDAETVLPDVLTTINQPAVFWLDGHWSGGITGRGLVADPVITLLNQLAVHQVKGHTILIDDARTFDGMQGSPDLLEILSILRQINPAYRILVHQDVIIATPAAPVS